MLYVFVTEQCKQDAVRIDTLQSVEGLAKKLVEEQSTQGLQRHPRPFLKKRFGRTRLIIAEVFDGDDVILCFLRHVYKHEINNDYDTFFSKLTLPTPDDEDLKKFLEHERTKPVEVKPEPSELEIEYLVLDRDQEMGQVTVLESPLWVKAIKQFSETQGKAGLLTPIWELVQEVLDDVAGAAGEETKVSHKTHGVTIFYRYYQDLSALYLVGVAENGASSSIDSNFAVVEKLKEDSATFESNDLRRNSIRAYPDFILYDREVWESTQTSVDANLSLSPEESDVLTHVLDPAIPGGFPLFINGRPGSGKSTILQYLFAEYLHAHLARPVDRRLPNPPLYLTYNERLLDNAKSLIGDIFRCGGEKLAKSENIDWEDKEIKQQFENAFAYFREFLLSLIDKKRFDRGKYVDFHGFRSLYEILSKSPDSKLRRLTAEVAWHTLRTYIKGKSTGTSEYFDPESYAELPREEVTVAPETYELVWDKVWNGWYRDLCVDEGYWDDQDLAREVLDLDLVPSEFPGVFCDEAQDFTTIELELIFKLSRFVTKRVDSYYLPRIPYVFAGDPFQTLNPTGFRWDAIKANFHDNIVRQLDPDKHAKVEMTFKELAYNYRSTSRIVRFSNLIQLQRAELFDIKDVYPQTAWSIEEGASPAFFELDLGTQGKLKEQSELVIIVPCQEGEEDAFVESDDYLRTIAKSSEGGLTRYVLSPMRAKGLEFGRVVLYKFGSHAIADGHVALMRHLRDRGLAAASREETLGLEYFFNGVYVAASRAQKRLLIVDSPEGVDKFWNFATDATELNRLLTEKRREWWSENDIHHMLRGDSATWAEDRDDPAMLAQQFYSQGLLERSTYLLGLARNQFDTLGDREKTERCSALIYDYEGNFEAAADSYVSLGERGEAIRCYWQAKKYEGVIGAAARDAARFGIYPVVSAAKYMSGERGVSNALAFLRAVGEGKRSLLQKQMKLSHWPDVFEKAASAWEQASALGQELDIEDAKEVFGALRRIEQEFSVPLSQTIGLAFLAHLSGDNATALDIWKAAQEKGKQRDPDFILRAKAQTSDYPMSLTWLQKLQDADSIIREYEENRSINIEDAERQVILDAYFKKEDFDGVERILLENPEWLSVRWALKHWPDHRKGRNSARKLIGLLVISGVRQKEYRKVLEDLKPGKTEIRTLDKLLSDDKILMASEAAIIKVLSRDKGLSESQSDDKFVSGRLSTMANKHAEKLKALVEMEELGGALERAGRMDNALKFYEAVYGKKIWGGNRGDLVEAKARWLKCKERQAKLDVTDLRRRDKRLAEAKERSAEWGVGVPTNEYPELGRLENDRVVSLFENRAHTEPIAEESVAVVGDMSTVSEPESGLVATSGDESVGKVEESSAVKLSDPSILPERPNFVGSIKIGFRLATRDLDISLLPSKRRLELRDTDSNDLVMLYADELLAESRDLSVENKGEGIWIVEEWGVSLYMLRQGLNTSHILVDVVDGEGRRIIALAL